MRWRRCWSSTPRMSSGATSTKHLIVCRCPISTTTKNVGLRVIDNSQIVGVQRNDTGFYKATYGHPLSTIEIQKNAIAIENLLNNAGIGKRLVARWFNFQGESLDDAFFDTQLIQERGQYNASDVDVAVALQTVRGVAALSDAGEELISQTFVLVNDITYVTAEQEAEVAKQRSLSWEA